ncbi:MAG: adenylate/guanylate cyclase domain-containing protein [Mycobacterium sp.]
MVSRHSPAERKQVTVLFADVVGSMALAAALETERLREIMHDLFNRSADVVQRYQGTVDKFTGDGLMALFGAPVALEDHALRACIAALGIQSVAGDLAADVKRKDGTELRIRIGINSGEVITGEIGIGPGRYTAVGHPVGMAQRMEAAAPPGGIMCAATTAGLVEHSTVLGPLEWVAIKGTAEPVPARRLEGVESDRAILGRDDGPLVGRDADLTAMLGAFDDGAVSVACVVAEPGLGKSRLIREFGSRATAAGADVIVARCESHTANVPLHALARLLRSMFGIRDLDAEAARAHVADQLKDVTEPDSGEAEILFDLLSIGDPNGAESTMGADARRRRLIEVLGRFAANRSARTLYVIEDVHWIDAASDEVLTSFATNLSGTRSVFVASFRPEYRGRLREASAATIVLAPLNAATTHSLALELMGPHPSVRGVARRIAMPSGGNPFFVEEIVRDLVGRDFLVGNRGDYRLVGDVDAISVPATVQSVLAARIDRLSAAEKSILNAGSVIGASFDVDILEVLLPNVESRDLQSLVSAELIDQIQLLPESRYAFRHPLVRAVSYESQLLATRTDGHTRLAAAIELRNPSAVEENSALIAQHLEAAGDLDAAYAWYMRAGEWLSHRDTIGARDSWERARKISDDLPDGQEGVIGKRIAPRAQLTFRPWLVGEAGDDERRFDELRQLTTQSGDMRSLAMGMAGRVTSLVLTHGRPRDAAILASELSELIDEVDGSAPEKAEMLLAVAFARYETGALEESLQAVDRLRTMAPRAAATDLAPATCLAGAIEVLVGRREDGGRELEIGLGLARTEDPVCHAIAVSYRMDLVLLGFDLVDEALLAQTRDALVRAEEFGDPYALATARSAHGFALLRSGRGGGSDLLRRSRSEGIDVYGGAIDAELAVELARNGRQDPPVGELRAAVQEEIDSGGALFAGYPLAVLVRLMVVRGGSEDVERAHDLVADFETGLPATRQPAIELWLLQSRATLASASGDAPGYSRLVTRYRELARRLDARAHLAAAERLAAGRGIEP